jgi:hypothetical protein
MCVVAIFAKQTVPYFRTDPMSPFTAVSNKMDELLKKHMPPISISLLFGGIFATHISHCYPASKNIAKYLKHVV